MLSSSVLLCVPPFRQVQNYCASWALPPQNTFPFMVEIHFYIWLHVHATQRELAGQEVRQAFFKIAVRHEAWPIRTKEFQWN